jgi:hypothetical protein
MGCIIWGTRPSLNNENSQPIVWAIIMMEAVKEIEPDIRSNSTVNLRQEQSTA